MGINKENLEKARFKGRKVEVRKDEKKNKLFKAGRSKKILMD